MNEVRDQREVNPGNVGVATQLANPSRATARTAVAVLVGIVIALPVLNSALLIVQDELTRQSDLSIAPWVWLAVNGALAAVGLVSSIVTRVLAVPGVNSWIESHVPALAPVRIVRPRFSVDESELTQ